VTDHLRATGFGSLTGDDALPKDCKFALTTVTGRPAGTVTVEHR